MSEPDVTAFESNMESSQEELLRLVDAPSRQNRSRWKLGLVVCLVTAFAATAVWSRPNGITQVNSGLIVGFSSTCNETCQERLKNKSLEQEWWNSCHKLPFVVMTRVVSSNLGKQGPDTDAEEGIIYEARVRNVGIKDNKTIQIHVHSVKDFNVNTDDADSYDPNYRAAFTQGEFKNGIHGRFVAINVKQNESVKLRAHAYDPEEKKDLTLLRSAISFFDLDTGENGTRSVEHIAIRNFKAYYLSNETELNVEERGDRTFFTASTVGTGEDNPESPVELTKQQKDRTVTIEYEDAKDYDFEIGASEGKTGRVFMFVFRPSLLCARTKLADGTLTPATGARAALVLERSATHNVARLSISCIGIIAIILQGFS